MANERGDACAKCGKTLAGADLFRAFSCRECGQMFCGQCAGGGSGSPMRFSCPQCAGGSKPTAATGAKKWWQFWK